MASFKISPSLASVPLINLKESLADLESAGVDYLHFDLEDGVFVPVMTLGTKLISDLRPLTKLPFDVHLMVQDPEWLIPQVIALGADRVAIHYEACLYPRRVLRQISELGAAPGLAFNPATPLPDLSYLAPYLEFIIILTTEPEGPDCPYLPGVLEKLKDKSGNPFLESLEWVVDGGVDVDNIEEVLNAGGDTVVVGRYAFKDGKITHNINQLRAAAGIK
jgi:ribulose-phosphate 3-epimerase